MGFSPRPSRLTPLQRDLLDAFFAREQRLFLTGGGALAGFYLGHRTTEDLDLFTLPGPDLGDAARALDEAARSLGATAVPRTTYQDFRRILVQRGEETCVVDLVVDRAPAVDREKTSFGTVIVDTMREIAANKITTLLSRSEIKDLVDLVALTESGIDLDQAIVDARKKDGGAEPATLAWLLEQIEIGPDARLPGNMAPERIIAMRDSLVRRLREMAFKEAQRGGLPSP
ncbi:MAG: nucleotidyl transferase AbiEii/AbiGii toxin family protein [Polyangiaceae bacterium]|nr:nucleotidyl transferase AbiEii/AbiGii toxin family protein [Polyangiaceae bacterium]